jgi:putative oxidoreductase
METLRKAYASFVEAASKLRSPFLLFVRIYWGWQFMQTGWGKLHRLPQVTQFFSSLNLPLPGVTAPLVSTMELIGGLLLILGLASRLTGLVLAFDMLVAYLASDRTALLSFWSDPGKFYNADPYTFLFAGLLILIFGPGCFSLDTLLASRFKRSSISPPN